MFFQVLRKGLIKAAKTTGAWIFTGGTNTGEHHFLQCHKHKKKFYATSLHIYNFI